MLIRLPRLSGVEGGEEMQSSRIRKPGVGHQTGGIMVWSKKTRKSNHSPLPAGEDRYTQAGAVWPPSEPIEEQEPLLVVRREGNHIRKYDPETGTDPLRKKSRQGMGKGLGISILESESARHGRGRDTGGRFIRFRRSRVVLGRDARRRPGGRKTAVSTRLNGEEYARSRDKRVVLRRYGTDRQAREQGIGPRMDRESTAQLLRPLSASKRYTRNAPGETGTPKPVGAPAVETVKSNRTIQAIAAYRRFLRTSTNPTAALQHTAREYGAWIFEADSGPGRAFWAEVMRRRMPIPPAYQEVVHGPGRAEDVFWREEPAFGSMQGGSLHRSMSMAEKARPSYRRRLARAKAKRKRMQEWAKREPLSRKELGDVLARFGRVGCTFARFGSGFVCYTHRARSKAYPTIAAMPKRVVAFIDSTC